MTAENTLPIPKKSVCIIGAGPCGLAALKAFKDSPKTSHWNITVFEKKPGVGGVWIADPTPPSPPSLPTSPIYNSLTTNLPHPVMAFYSHAFPPSTPLFPGHKTVLEYIQSYAERFGLLEYVQFRSEVVKSTWDGGINNWRITVETLNDSNKIRTTTYSFDILIICSGHYTYPYTPSWPGLGTWLEHNNTRSITHACYYRTPSPYTSQTVIVVGAGPSGRDISNEIAGVAKLVHWSVPMPVYQDIISGSASIPTNVIPKPPIRRFDAERIEFEDDTVIGDVDIVLPATGYRYHYPFLSPPIINDTSELGGKSIRNTTALLETNGKRITPLNYHIYPPPPPPTHNNNNIPIYFLGLPSKVIPFPLFEIQSLALVSLLTSSLTPPASPLFSIPPRQSHVLDSLQFEYCNTLAEMFGLEWRVKEWVPRMYEKKEVLRRGWREVEKRGEGRKLVEGVGKEVEWVRVMEGLIGVGEKDENDEREIQLESDVGI